MLSAYINISVYDKYDFIVIQCQNYNLIICNHLKNMCTCHRF